MAWRDLLIQERARLFVGRERELGQIKPEDFPTASELRSNPDEVAPVFDVEPAITRID